MAKFEIRKYPDKVLQKKCRDVAVIDGEIRRLLDDMLVTLRAEKGLGLAAPQIGLDMRLIVVELDGKVLKLVNPKIVEREGISILEEGCLSLPDLNIKVKRANKVTISTLEAYGKAELIRAEGLLSHILQHEIDHLNGKLLIDYLPFYKKFIVKRRLLKYH